MKMKLTTLLFGLLLAVGWTSNASAQAQPEGGWAKRMGIPSAMLSAPAQAPLRADLSEAVHDKAYYQQFTYSWTDGNGVTHENVDPTEPATDPYQIYELLRFVYTNPNFPGPYYSAYTPTYNREDPVYYGGISGGWDIPGSIINPVGDITITTTRNNNRYIWIHSIAVYDLNGVELVNWVAPANATGTSLTSAGLTYSGTVAAGSTNGTNYIYLNNATGTITIPSSRLNGATNVRVVINARRSSNNTGPTLSYTVNGTTTNQAVTNNFTDYTWNISGTSTNDVNYYKPYEDGYTVVLVALKDKAEMTLAPEVWPSNSSHFEQKSQLITYFQNNLEYVRLLTDGLRIGQGQGTGTVFNADGRLNRFFFLGKGQARKKAPRIKAFINQGGNIIFQQFQVNGTNYTTVDYQDWFGEDVPFEEMYEQFSPTSTTVSDESQTTDLFDKLREGNVYSVQHDCGSVMQAEHEFSLSGKNGTEHYPFSGLNFFVPDYRLLFWTTQFTSGNTTYTVDGRDNIPYESANTNYTQPEGSHGSYFSGVSDGTAYTRPTWYSAWSAYYAVYNKTYAPKVGIYRITLDAQATQVGTSHNPSNLNYNVTLTWVSSLNEMTGSTVPQTYTMYIIDENGNRTQLEPVGVKFYDIYGNELNADDQNPFHVTQAVYAVPQNEHSYTIEYQVDGVADAGPAFHATSNRASVIIPGWNDFVGLQLDHHESDFVITKNQQTGQSSLRHNWYRNFLAMVNEDIVNGLTVSKITGASDDGVVMNEFNLYRFLPDAQGNPTAETKVATIKFDQASDEQVHFNVSYFNQEIEEYDLTYKEGNQNVTVANAYSRANLGIPEQGWVRVKGNGDIVIWPNSYSVNIRSIRVYQNATGNQTVPNATWTAPNNLPNSWYVSPGSKWEEHTTEAGTQVGYMEGGGYIAIPNVLDNYPSARVVIEAFGEAGSISRITVNDVTQNITATAAGTNYTWQTVSPNAAPSRAGETQIVTESFEDENTFPSFGLGGITADNHTGRFGDWTIYDSTGAIVWGMENLTWDNQFAPQAWMPFNGYTVNQATAHSGNKYMESICPDEDAAVAADSWLISPELSGNAQTITFWAKEFVTTYGAESFEVLYSTTDFNRDDFSQSTSSFIRVATLSAESTDWAEYSVNLPEGAKYFAIRHVSDNVFGMMIDDVTYEIANEAPAAEGGLLRLHLLMADQLKAEIPDDNSHPDAYGYVLRWEQPANAEDRKQSGTVRVNIQKTDCDVMGYYTLDEIDKDTDRGLTMDVLTADVEYNLSSSNELLNYYNLQAEADQDPSFNEDYVSRLHRQENFTYREMLETSPNFDQVYPSGEHHYFDDSEPIKTGFYNVGNRFMSYAPSVSTWGIQRRYYEYDGLDNTYGGPVWKTAVGKAEMNSVTAERQTNNSNSVNWTDQGGAASLYILDNIEAVGYLPPADLTKVEFEPYMFRVFVESKNGKLRPYQVVEAGVDPDKPGEHLAPIDGELTEADMKGPYCVWSGYVKYDSDGMPTDDPENGVEITNGSTAGSYIYHKDKVDRTGGSNANPLGEWDKDAQNAMFGALDALTTENVNGKDVIIEDDLKFFVRFYFSVKGELASHTVGTRGEGSRAGNGAESDGRSGDSATAVSEITYLGEIVSQTYFNVQGMESDKPFDGVNIVVTRFSDGTTSISKVVR